MGIVLAQRESVSMTLHLQAYIGYVAVFIVLLLIMLLVVVYCYLDFVVVCLVLYPWGMTKCCHIGAIKSEVEEERRQKAHVSLFLLTHRCKVY